MVICYAFEAKSIQEYVLNSGKLKDMVGASEIVNQLIGEPLQQALKAVELQDHDSINFSRRASGAFVAFMDDQEKAEALRDLWSLVVPHFAPGLHFVHTVAQAETEREAAGKALKKLQTSHFPQPDIPSASPLTRYSPRTGVPAAVIQRAAGGNEWVDNATFRKRDSSFGKGRSLAQKFSVREFNWPVNMLADFPFQGDNSYVGIIHADGNGLGNILRILQANANDDNYRELYRSFSAKLGAATCQAAQKATVDILIPAVGHNGFLPARPLVLGGDDLTIIVRGDLALSFTKCFLEAFEEFSKEVCEFLKVQKMGWRQDFLTACAGIAYVKSNQPFAMGYALAEELCGQSKEMSKRNASALSFHRVATSFIPDAEWVWQNEMTRKSADTSFIGTLGCYQVGQTQSDLPKLEYLLGLKKVIDSTGVRSGAGLMRKLLGIMHEPPQVAREMYSRWRTLLKEEGMKNSDLLPIFDSGLIQLLGNQVVPDLPARKIPDGRNMNQYESPLGDILALKAVGGEA